MKNNKYDLIVIGAGSAGVRSARLYGAKGFKVALIEKSDLGGTCVNVGCIPKKLMVKSAHFKHDFELAKKYGWDLGNISFNWQRLVENKNTEIKRLNGIYEKIIKNNRVELIQGSAKFVDENLVEVIKDNGEKEVLEGEKIIIAVGGKPIDLPCKGGEYAINSDEFFFMQNLPKKAVVVGGGYIALELASIMQELGVKVTLIHRSDKVLRGFDYEMTQMVLDNLRKQGMNISLETSIQEISKKSENNFLVKLNSDEEIDTNCILVAIGRKPNIDSLNLGLANINLNEKGSIDVNNNFQTSNKFVYALGDVIAGCTAHKGQLTLTPVAIKQAVHLINHWENKVEIKFDYTNIATSTFVMPTCSSVGYSEEQAKEHCKNIKIYKSHFAPLPETLNDEDKKSRVFIKVLVDEDSKKIVGVHMIGDDSENIIQIIGVCVKAGLTKNQFDETIAVHPSVAEEFVLLN